MKCLILLFLLTGCASNDEYRVNAFSPKKGPDCPGDAYPVCEIGVGRTICSCTEPLERADFDDAGWNPN